ncbi:MAG: hypothetical protein RLY16_565, partial [Bacteroidota bacterium]
MKRIYTFFLSLAFAAVCNYTHAQNSVLVNFGSSTCSVATQPSFTLIKNPLGVTPILLSDCSMTTQLPDFFSVFVAYNPKNNKVYIADVRSGIQTKIWVLDIGLPSQIGCPITIPATPTYTYSYVSNNFEFDNNGDLWSFSNFNSFTGQCNLDKFDVNTGLVINSRTLQFPAGNFPNTISSGDLCILPNGRMFATLGAGPSRLYEITNYSGNTTANATFLTQLPQDCFGIAYLNGQLEVTGNDFSAGCYYFDYDISTGALGTQKPFQVGNSPIDNTSFTPAIGCTKRLLNANAVNSNTYDLTYEIYVENMGNVILNNLNISDNLTATFGAGNVSNVQASFVSGFNAANLSLNPSFNGTTNTSLLAANQNLPNRILLNTDYLFKIQVSCRATNLQPNITYLNRAICTGNIGASNANTLVNVIDSSNNGQSNAVDPNNNGNANELNENIPTPFSFGLVPVKFIGVSATLVNNHKSTVQWQVATPMIDAQKFEVEFSRDGRGWQSLGSIAITNNRQGNYQFTHPNLPEGMLYYRIRQTDIDGSYIFSNTVLLRNIGTGGSLVVY